MKLMLDAFLLLTGVWQASALSIPFISRDESERSANTTPTAPPQLISARHLEHTLIEYAATCAAVGIGNVVALYNSSRWCMVTPKHSCPKAIEDEIWTISKKAIPEARARWAGLIHEGCDHGCALQASEIVAKIALNNGMQWARYNAHSNTSTDATIDHKIQKLIHSVRVGHHPYIKDQQATFEIVQHLIALNHGHPKHKPTENHVTGGKNDDPDALNSPTAPSYALIDDTSSIDDGTSTPLIPRDDDDPLASIRDLTEQVLAEIMPVFRKDHARIEQDLAEQKARDRKWYPWKPDFKMKDGGHTHTSAFSIAEPITHVGLHTLPGIIELILLVFGIVI